MEPTIEETLLSEWTTAVEALDTDSIKELFDIQPSLLWTPLQPLSHLETDFSHFIRRLKEHKILGTTIRPVCALHHILYDYGVPDDEWAPERIELVDFILKNTKGNELNTSFWGEEENTVMHLAYFIQQPELIQQLKEYGAVETIKNKSNHLPNIQPEVKLLVSKQPHKERVVPTNNASDRFKRLRELAESPNLNKPTTERQNSTRRYFQPGHLEERRRRVLSEEEQAELDKKNLLRQKEVDQLAQRSAVKNNPLFKKFEEEGLLKDKNQQQTKRTPSITAASAVRDRKKLLGAADQIRRTSRVINSLKDRSYVSTSVFKQAPEPTVHRTGNTLHVPTLAQLRAGSPNPTINSNISPSVSPRASPNVSPSVSPNVSPHTSDNEEEDNEPIKKMDEKVDEVDSISNKKEDDTLNTEQSITVHVPDRLTETDKKKTENSASNNDKRGVTEEDLEPLSVGRLGDREKLNPTKKTKKEIDITANKVKDIVNVHERLFDENEVEIIPIGKKFAVWKKGDEEFPDSVESQSISENKLLDEENVSKKESIQDTVEVKKDNSIENQLPIENIKDKPISEIDTKDDLNTISLNEKSKLTKTPLPLKEPIIESSIVKDRVMLVDEQAAIDDQNAVIPIKEKTEYSYQNKNTATKDEPVTVIPTSDSVTINKSSDIQFTEKTRTNDKIVASNLVSNSVSLLNEADISEKENTRAISNEKIIGSKIVSTSISALNEADENKSLQEKPRLISQEKIIASAIVSTSISALNEADAIENKLLEKSRSIPDNKPGSSNNSLIDNKLVEKEPLSTIAMDKTKVVNNSIISKKEEDKISTIQKNKSIDQDINVPNTVQMRSIGNKDNLSSNEKNVTLPNESIIEDTYSKTPSLNIPNKIIEQPKTSTPLFDDELSFTDHYQTRSSEENEHITSSFLDDLTFEDDIVPQSDNTLKNTLIENETSPIPTLTNQIESNHEKLNHSMVETNTNTPHNDEEDTSSSSSDDDGDYLNTTHTQPIDKTSLSAHTINYNTNTNNLANQVLHLEINTNKSRMMIEEESDEDEAATPTLANNPYQMKKKILEESSDEENEENKQEWRSAYNSLVADQQQVEFEDDILRQKTLYNRESMSSDLDETSIIQTLTYQNETKLNNWNNNKRQSGSQRNHWSVGIQDSMKRESLLSKNESIATSEAGSDQWFDPEEDWNEQEELRRQSMLVSGFHATQNESYHHDDYYFNNNNNRNSDSSMNTNSETYSYKNSNSTENTTIDEEDEEDEYERKETYRQEILEEEEEDYYSTNLHTVNNVTKTRGESSYYHGGQSDNEQQEQEGEIVVFMNQSPTKNRQENNITTTAFYNNSNSTNNTIKKAPITNNFSTSTLSVNNQREDDEISLIKVPSRTIAIAEANTQQEIVPHDPNNPRVEDISHYMNKLPAFEKSNNIDTSVHGGSAFDTTNNEVDNEPAIIKRAISTSQQNGQPQEQSRGIPNAHEINTEFNMFVEKRTSQEDYKISMSSIDVNRFGKMYIGVSGAHHMLLPLPKEITYVRCVISDGEYEYMSKYEILGHQILMDYECCIDTKPGMIITVSLHVRPDYHVRPRTGWSKWFTSIRKQKEHLSGYVHPEDGAIGQTRFAVDHMVPGCHKKTYEAHFDCFNSWYARTNRERARREQFGDDEDFLKIVGKLNVEMLYLPVSNPSVPVPRSLRECDLTLKIRQWHDTCWQSGYLSTRRQGLKIWERHYYRLIGSQLIGYTSDGLDRQVWDHYNMSDVIRLSAAADKVIVTLIEDEDDKVFTQETIHAENHKGFFRLAFPDYHLDCVSDDLQESEEWVKTLKSMIGRVPLRLPFSD